MWGDDDVLVFRQDFDEKCGVKKDAISKELWGQSANHIQGRGDERQWFDSSGLGSN